MRSKLNSIVALLGGRINVVMFSAMKTAKGHSYTAEVSYVDATQTPPVLVASAFICDSKGKIRKFVEIDNFFAEAAKMSVLAENVQSGLSNVALLSPAPFTGDIIKKNQTTLAAYTAQKTAQDLTVSTITTEVSLLTSEVTTAPSFLVEKQAQLDGATGFQSWLAAEIARITAALAPPAGLVSM